jgi:hypothetical protein
MIDIFALTTQRSKKIEAVLNQQNLPESEHTFFQFQFILKNRIICIYLSKVLYVRNFFYHQTAFDKINKQNRVRL